MPSAFSHAAVALALGAGFPKSATRRLLAAGVACACLPDLDVIGFRFGIHYGDLLGHRGLTHSLFFALFLALIVAWMLARPLRWQHALYLFLATASHGVFDAFTNGGLGVAFFAPFSSARYFFPFRPIEVSPIGVQRFMSERGLSVLTSELIWIWIPCAVFAGVACLLHRKRSHAKEEAVR